MEEKQMKKIFAMLLCICLLVGVLFACTTKEPNTPDNSQPSSTEDNSTTSSSDSASESDSSNTAAPSDDNDDEKNMFLYTKTL